MYQKNALRTHCYVFLRIFLNPILQGKIAKYCCFSVGVDCWCEVISRSWAYVGLLWGHLQVLWRTRGGLSYCDHLSEVLGAELPGDYPVFV